MRQLVEMLRGWGTMACSITLELSGSPRSRELLDELRTMAPGVAFTETRPNVFEAEYKQRHVTWEQGQQSLLDVLNSIDPTWSGEIGLGHSFTYSE